MANHVHEIKVSKDFLIEAKGEVRRHCYKQKIHWSKLGVCYIVALIG